MSPDRLERCFGSCRAFGETSGKHTKAQGRCGNRSANKTLKQLRSKPQKQLCTLPCLSAGARRACSIGPMSLSGMSSPASGLPGMDGSMSVAHRTTSAIHGAMQGGKPTRLETSEVNQPCRDLRVRTPLT